MVFCVVFNVHDPIEIYTLSLHDALPISECQQSLFESHFATGQSERDCRDRSEERFSRNAETDLVCRLLLEKKKSKFFHRCRHALFEYRSNDPTVARASHAAAAP